ncbi:MAG: alpha/beta hydrolase-fold protein [Anaerolineales bacterium]
MKHILCWLDGAHCPAYTLGNRRPRRLANPAGRRVSFWTRSALVSGLAIASILLADCGYAPVSPTAIPGTSTQESTPAAPTPVPSTAAPTSTPNPTPSATNPEPSCRQPGVIQHDTVPQDGFGRELPFAIYLPPCYSDIRGGLPTLYLLHGLAADDEQWPRLGIAEAADHVISDLGSPPFLVVMPWQRTGLDSEAAILQGLLPYVEAHYHALPGPTWRAIGGLSRGAGWAFRLGMRHADKFSAVGLHSPALLDGDLVALQRWLSQPEAAHHPKLWVDIGDRDTLRAAAEGMQSRLDQLGVPYEFHLGKGWHDEAYWGSRLGEYLAWYTAHW